ncbi:MAG: hypothetical protein J6P20_04775, partial [Oscillospiraceae bacterium]|nr:hypothetical protein [Oscillospiraceae bacterium]
SDGANALYNGILTLQDGCVRLADGAEKLNGGAMQLSDGLKQFNEKGIQKLREAVSGDLAGLLDRFKAMVDVSRSYKTFSGLPDDMDGRVKFIYKTDEIRKPEE